MDNHLFDFLHQTWCSVQMALSMSFYMFWEMLWALIIGFALSAVVQVVFTKSEISKWLADSGLKSLTRATLGGAVSSSCSYAAVAIARALVKQEANFTSAMAFQFASTNLVIELSILLTILLGWQFMVAQFVGGIVMIATMAIIFDLFLPKRLVQEAREHAQSDIAGKMEGHASMNMSVDSRNSLWQRIFSEEGKTAISHSFFMDWASLWPDIVVGILVAGILSAFVPNSFWAFLFCRDNYHMAQLIGPLVGPLIAVLSFVCSIGNVPMAAVLWQQGMSFGGVLSFLFADLLVLPLLDIYRKYYGIKMAGFLAISFYISMVISAYFCQWLFRILDIFPVYGSSRIVTHGAVFYYTTILNLIAIVLVLLLFWRFHKTGGLQMLAQIKKGAGKSCCH